MVALYHYTSEEGKDAIIADRLIRATDEKDGLGKVVRFTPLPYNTNKYKLTANNWRLYHAPEDAKLRLKYCFKFDSGNLPAKKVRAKEFNGRNIWVCKEDVPLDVHQDASNRTKTYFYCTTGRGGRGACVQHVYNEEVVDKDLDKKPMTYYHYTDRADRDAILKRGYIEGRCDWSMLDFNPVVQLTDVAPTEPKSDIIYHMFGVKSEDITPALLARTEHWFKFERSELRKVRAHKEFGKRSWTTPSDMYFYAHDGLPDGGSISLRTKAVLDGQSDGLGAVDDSASYVYISAVKKL